MIIKNGYSNKIGAGRNKMFRLSPSKQKKNFAIALDVIINFKKYM